VKFKRFILIQDLPDFQIVHSYVSAALEVQRSTRGQQQPALLSTSSASRATDAHGADVTAGLTLPGPTAARP